MTRFWIGLILLVQGSLFAQTTLTGKVVDNEGLPLPGANVYLEDSYDGATTDTAGVFRFTTTETGEWTLVASYVGFEPYREKITLEGGTIERVVSLAIDMNEENTVVISAGGFGVGDREKAVILNPIDIVTTAGALGDVYGALNYLPGTTPNGTENGLFVRGGAASETATLIDGMLVQQPFFGSVPDIASRSRFSPFLFKGTFFSTGGYSARYGQALSSALILNTQDMPDTSGGGINLTLVGGGGYYTYKRRNTSITATANYSDVKPLFYINKQLPDWEIAPRAGSGSLILRQKVGRDGILKGYGSFSHNWFVVKRPDPFDPTYVSRTKMVGMNGLGRITYTDLLGKNWVVFAGLTYSADGNDLAYTRPVAGLSNSFTTNIRDYDYRTQGRVQFTRNLRKNAKLWFGTETAEVHYRTQVDSLDFNTDDRYRAGFVEGEVYFGPKLAARLGVRGEYSSLIDRFNAAPRASLAYQTSKNSSVSLAYGQFFQTPAVDSFYHPALNYERATHYIANFQWAKSSRTFRVEGYYKIYDQLVRRKVTIIDNSGYGYARGVDVFWRDQKTFKNVDYWISYSYLDTKRLYRDFPIEASPTFSSPHNLSLVYKQYFSKLRSQIGASYTWGAGRPYYNPDTDVEFHSEVTPNYHMLALNWSYLTTIKDNFTVIFFSLNNALNRLNVFGYRFSPDGQTQLPVTATNGRSVFLGIFMSID